MNRFQLTDALKQAILQLAAQPDIHSISCPFTDFDLWRGLLGEQVKRSRLMGKPPQEAFYLIGPSCGILGLTDGILGDDEGTLPPIPDPLTGNYAPDRWGGDIHIPYEGTVGADLFILPDWHFAFPERLAAPNARMNWMVGRPCNYILTNRDLGEFECATRTITADCYLYKSNGPYLDCKAFAHSLCGA